MKVVHPETRHRLQNVIDLLSARKKSKGGAKDNGVCQKQWSIVSIVFFGNFNVAKISQRGASLTPLPPVFVRNLKNLAENMAFLLLSQI